MAQDVTGQHEIRFLLNGRQVTAQNTACSTTLLDFVRSQGLTGAKEGCAEGECGACTMLMVRARKEGDRSRFVPFNSCLMLLPMAAGQEIYTVEALGGEGARGGSLAEAQQAMVAHAGSQCGYCTPGFVVSLFAEQYRPGRKGPCDPQALRGNLCRCTGYRPIRDAALSLGPAPEGWFRERLEQPAPEVDAASCGYGDARGESRFLRPSNLPDCLDLLAEYPQARLIAGGTDLVVESNLRDRRFPLLISVEGLPELREFDDGEDAIHIGAGLSLSEIGERWLGAPSVLAEWLRLFASPLIRNRATLGGNLATASPIGDGAPLLLALDAEVEIAGAEGRRRVLLSEFFRGYRETALSRREVLVAVRIPKPVRAETRFYKIAKRRTDDISTVAAAISITLDCAGRVERARLAYGGVAATPLRAHEAEETVVGRVWNEATIRRAQEALARTLHPLSDHRGSAKYRLAMTQSLLEKYAHETGLEAAA